MKTIYLLQYKNLSNSIWLLHSPSHFTMLHYLEVTEIQRTQRVSTKTLPKLYKNNTLIECQRHYKISDLHHMWPLNILLFCMQFLACHFVFCLSSPLPSSKGKLSFCETQQLLNLSSAEFKQLCKGEYCVGCLGRRWEQAKQDINICGLSK